MWKRGKSSEVLAHPFPPELLAEAKTTPGGWVYSIDAAYAPDGASGRVPPEGIIGGWKIGDNGTPTGEYRANPNYVSRPPAQ